MYVHERVQLPDLNHPTLDSQVHDQWARGIAFGQWSAELSAIQNEPYFRAPLYPYFLAAIYRWLGDGPMVLFAIQALLGALTAAILFFFCRETIGERAAWVAVVLYLGYWPFTYHEAERMLPALVLPLDMLTLATVAMAGRTGKYLHTCGAGLAAGLSAIARPSILIVVPFVVLWLLYRVRINRWRHAALLIAFTLIVILPVTLRNAVVGRDFVPIAWQGGVNFFIGNNPQSNGIVAVVPGARADWWGGFDDTRRLAEEEVGHPLKPSRISRFWYRQGIEFLVNEPGAALRLYVRKVRLLLGNAEPSNERQLYFRRKRSAVLSWLRVNFAFIMSTAVVGAGVALRSTRSIVRLDRLLPLCFAIPYAVGVVLFFVTSRFRLPVALFLIPMSALGCVAVLDWLRAHQWRPAITASTISGALFILSMHNPYHVGAMADARGYYDLGLDHFRERDYAAALTAFNCAIDADSGFAPSWVARGRIHNLIGHGDRAIEDLERACTLDPSNADSFYWLGVAYQKADDHARAEPAYRRSLALDPTRIEALTNLADVYFRQNRVSDAREMLESALRIDSTYANALYGMGHYYEITGQRERATVLYARALPFSPARKALDRLQEKERDTNEYTNEVR